MADTGTAARTILYRDTGTPTHAYTVVEVALRRDKTRIDAEVAQSDHHESLKQGLRLLTGQKSRRSVPELLEELAVDRGMAWVDIARMVGVSVSAVRKWRGGGDANPESRQHLANLAAMLDTLENFSINDPASWMEMPLQLPPGYVVRPLDLYAEGHLSALLDIAALRRTEEDALTDIDPHWRDNRSDFEVYDAPDGHKAIIRRQT